jgi:nicotinate-nucleotide--dimethylbenzimidazole phosphoribosyltransferase
MTREQAIASLEAGAHLAEEAIAEGADLLGTGEMGIGNTTAASAITAVITGAPAEAVTGRGTGIDDATWRRKVEVVERAPAVNRPDVSDAVDVLAKVGGFEIGGLAGAISRGRRTGAHGLDGFIAAAGLIAVTLAPAARGTCSALIARRNPATLTPSPISAGTVPGPVDAARRGTGPRSSSIWPAPPRIYVEMATFKSAGVDGPR